MINLYISLIKEGLRTIEQVPEKWRNEVKHKLEGGTNSWIG